MKILIVCIAIITALSGCAAIQKSDPLAQEQRRKLVLAQILLEDKRTAAAKELLTAVCSAPTVAGITDEALFRLALLNLEAGEQKIATGKAGKYLDKLLSNPGSSTWKSHAATLKGLIDAYEIALDEKSELERATRSLKNSNLSLTKENRDLRQDIEKLKNLDLELEMKKKK